MSPTRSEKPIRVGLTGFGRVGRNFLRLVWDLEDVEVTAIADPADSETLEYLLRFDTLAGRFPVDVSASEEALFLAGQRIPLVATTEPGEIDWAAHGTDVVIEASGTSRSRAELEGHLERGAGRVVLCVPPLDDPDITAFVGLNDDQLAHGHRIISNGSSTAHCAAPILEILDRAFGVERCFLNSVHAYTNKQRLADVPTEDMRSGRAAAENIIPQETGTAPLITGVLPQLNGKIFASAMNVPVPNGSVVDLTCWHREPVDVTSINEVIRTAASAHWFGIVEYEDDPIVSTDIENSRYSATFDGPSTRVLGDRLSKTIAWFDNHQGYVNRLLDLIYRLRRLEREAA